MTAAKSKSNTANNKMKLSQSFLTFGNAILTNKTCQNTRVSRALIGLQLFVVSSKCASPIVTGVRLCLRPVHILDLVEQQLMLLRTGGGA